MLLILERGDGMESDQRSICRDNRSRRAYDDSPGPLNHCYHAYAPARDAMYSLTARPEYYPSSSSTVQPKALANSLRRKHAFVSRESCRRDQYANNE